MQPKKDHTAEQILFAPSIAKRCNSSVSDHLDTAENPYGTYCGTSDIAATNLLRMSKTLANNGFKAQALRLDPVGHLSHQVALC